MGQGLGLWGQAGLAQGSCPGIYARSSDISIDLLYLCCTEMGRPPRPWTEAADSCNLAHFSHKPLRQRSPAASLTPMGRPAASRLRALTLAGRDRLALLGLPFRAEPHSKTQWSHIQMGVRVG